MKQFKLKNPNPFHERILKHDSPLFQENIYNSDGNLIKQKDIQNIAVNVGGMFEQPVVLTEEEKNYIDKTYPGSYDEAIQYSTNPKLNKYYYICPRYWNLKDNIPVKPEDVTKPK